MVFKSTVLIASIFLLATSGFVWSAVKKPSEKLVVSSVSSEIGNLSQRFAMVKSSKRMSLGFKFSGASFSDSIVSFKTINGSSKKINSVPTYVSTFSLLLGYFKDNQVVDTARFNGDAIFELHEKGWVLISIN